MRKLITLSLAILLVCSMALTSFATWHPSVSGGCIHEVIGLKINDKKIDVKKLPYEALNIVNVQEAQTANRKLPANTDPDTMTETGMTYGRNAALIEQYNKTVSRGSVPAFIEAHKVNKNWGTEKPMLPLEIAGEKLKMNKAILNKYDFIHFFDLLIDMDLLREAAELKDDEAIDTIDLRISCSHLTRNSVMFYEQDLFKDDDAYVDIQIEDGKTVFNVEDLDFFEGKTDYHAYSFHIDMNDEDHWKLADNSVYTLCAKAAPAEYVK